MRNENLKNELNNIPQDIDREHIWVGIELPKRKRKRRGIFWILGLGSALLCVLLWSSYSQKNQISTPSISAKEELIEKLIESKISSENQIDNSQEKLADKNTNEINNGIESNNQQSIVPDQPISAPSIRKNITDSRSFNNGFSVNSNSGTGKTESEVNELNISENIVVDKQVSENQIDRDLMKDIALKFLEKIEDDNGNDKPKSQIDDLDLISLPFGLLQANRITVENTIDISEIKRNKSILWGVSLFSLMGKSNHDFGNSQYTENRLEDEKPLESISGGILGHLYVGNIEIFSGFSYFRHNTELVHTNQNYSILNSFNNQVKRVTTTDYTLYNAYQYLDLILGIGYNIHVSENWSVTPSLQVGFSIDFASKGNLFDQFDRIEDIPAIEVYNEYGNWQGQANLKISRNIGANWNVGLMTYLSASKRLARFDESAHSVSSYGVGVSIGTLLQ